VPSPLNLISKAGASSVRRSEAKRRSMQARLLKDLVAYTGFGRRHLFASQWKDELRTRSAGARRLIAKAETTIAARSGPAAVSESKLRLARFTVITRRFCTLGPRMRTTLCCTRPLRGPDSLMRHVIGDL
jgi:hypothetical protein